MPRVGDSVQSKLADGREQHVSLVRASPCQGKVLRCPTGPVSKTYCIQAIVSSNLVGSVEQAIESSKRCEMQLL